MLLVWRGQSVTLALPTLTPPLAARSQDSPGPAPVPSLQDYFYPTFYEQLSESTLESTSWLSQDPGKPAGSSCLPLSFLSDQGSQTERWVSIQGEEGWRQPCSAVPHAEGQRSETTAKAKMGRCSNDEIRARQPKATLCHSFHSWQGLAEARTPAPSTRPGWEREWIGTGTSGICPPPSPGPRILQISPLSQPLAVYK